MKHLHLTVLAALAATMLASVASAGIVPIAPPASLLPGALEDASNIHLIQETPDTTLAVGVNVDVTAAGLYYPGSALTPGTIPAGTRVASYILHADPPGTGLITFTGSWTAPGQILGIILSDSNLDNSDAILGNGGTAYPSGLQYRGLDFSLQIYPDFLFFNGSQLIVSVFRTARVIDQVRIITAVPEPSSMVLGLLGAVGLGMMVYRRKQTA